MLKRVVTMNKFYYIKIKTINEMRDIPKVIISDGLITVGKFTSYGAHKYAGKIIKAVFNGNIWISDRHFIIPKECVKTVYITKEK